jgi:hypothetical protein
MKFIKHPVNVKKSREKLSRVHALEIARRAMERGGPPQATFVEEMPNPMEQGMIPPEGGEGFDEMMNQLGAKRGGGM